MISLNKSHVEINNYFNRKGYLFKTMIKTYSEEDRLTGTSSVTMTTVPLVPISKDFPPIVSLKPITDHIPILVSDITSSDGVIETVYKLKPDDRVRYFVEEDPNPIVSCTKRKDRISSNIHNKTGFEIYSVLDNDNGYCMKYSTRFLSRKTPKREFTICLIDTISIGNNGDNNHTCDIVIEKIENNKCRDYMVSNINVETYYEDSILAPIVDNFYDKDRQLLKSAKGTLSVKDIDRIIKNYEFDNTILLPSEEL